MFHFHLFQKPNWWDYPRLLLWSNQRALIPMQQKWLIVLMLALVEVLLFIFSALFAEFWLRTRRWSLNERRCRNFQPESPCLTFFNRFTAYFISSNCSWLVEKLILLPCCYIVSIKPKIPIIIFIRISESYTNLGLRLIVIIIRLKS